MAPALAGMVNLPLQFTCFNKILVCDGYLRDDRFYALIGLKMRLMLQLLHALISCGITEQVNKGVKYTILAIAWRP